ncbi:MAG: redoxin domain-containing protein [Cyanothece sp. SIO2G6]|nr:redoxin domain-containing protein [Cyanothece sp. SIO2G6]
MLTSSDFSGLFNQRFFKNFFPVPATSLLNVGDRIPNFELPDVCSGNTFSLKNYLQEVAGSDRRLLLAFTRIFTEKQYCPLCFPHIQTLNHACQTLSDQGLDIIMITSTDEAQSQIVARDLMMKMPLLSDPNCQVFQQYQLGQALGAPLPAQFVVDAAGYIQFRHLFSFIEPNAAVDQLLAL